MTTEEKAKRYDEAIKKAKSWYIDAQIDFKKSLENLFPELKVSEDERIRQSLIHYLHGLGEFEYPDKETYNNWLAWLEKQGEQTPAWSEEDEEIYSRICYLIHSDAFENYDVDEVGKELGEYAKITDWLKTIKTRCAWKPSEEQMDALEHFVRSVGESGYASPYDNNTKLLYSLLGQLKKLKGE